MNKIRMAQVIQKRNENADATVQEAIDANGDYCPCDVYQNEDTKCPCLEFRTLPEPSVCHCGRYEKVEE